MTDAKPWTQEEEADLRGMFHGASHMMMLNAFATLDATRAQLERTRAVLENVDDKLSRSLDCKTELEARGLVLLARAVIRDAQALLKEKGE
jgi:hypothetical protein